MKQMEWKDRQLRALRSAPWTSRRLEAPRGLVPGTEVFHEIDDDASNNVTVHELEVRGLVLELQAVQQLLCGSAGRDVETLTHQLPGVHGHLDEGSSDALQDLFWAPLSPL